MAPDHLPKSLAFAGWTKDLVGCPFSSSSARVALTDIKASFDVTSLDITPSTSGVRADLGARVYAGSAKASFYVCVGSTVTCSISYSVSSASATTSFKPAIVGGKIDLQNPVIDLSVPSGNVAVSFSGCGVVSSLANKALPYVKSYLVGKLEGLLEDIAKQQVPPLVENALASFTSYSGSLAGFKVGASLKQVSTSSSALTLGVDATITPTSTASCTLPAAPSVAKTTSTPALGSHTEHLGVAISASAIRRAVNAAWKSGLLCFSQSKLNALGVSFGSVNIGLLLGLTKTTSMDLRAPTPPTVTLKAGTLGEVDVAIPIEAHVIGEGAGGVTTTVTAKTTARATTRLRIDGGSSALVLDLTKIDIDAVKLSSTNAQQVLPMAQLIEAALKGIALPALQEQLDGYALLPQVLHQTGGVLDDYYLHISRRANTTAHLMVYASLYQAPTSDSTAPYTLLVKKPGALIGGDAFEFRASGGDGGTPKELLRYRWRMDGGSWSVASYAAAWRKSFKNGKHSVEVKAVDLAGNSDATPARVDFQVDSIAPSISLQSGPPALLTTSTASILVSVNDNYSPQSKVAVRLQLERITPTGTVLVSDLPFVSGKTSFALTNLTPGDYSALLWARDEAGNVSAQLHVRFLREDPTTGGSNPPGGTNPPGENPPGGSNPGGNDPSGSNPGGTNPGGTNPGGTDPNGANPGGSDPGLGDPNAAPPSVSGGCSLSGTDSSRPDGALVFALLLLGLGARRRWRG